MEQINAVECLQVIQGFSKFIQEDVINEEYDYSSLQVRLPFDVSQAILKSAEGIPDELIGPDGRETRPHITIKYGIITSDVEEIKKLPLPKKITARLGKTALFRNPDADVLIIKVDSPDLIALNELVKKNIECIDTYPIYEPHATIAYLKPGAGDGFDGKTSFNGIAMEMTEIEFSPKANNIYIPIPLG